MDVKTGDRELIWREFTKPERSIEAAEFNATSNTTASLTLLPSGSNSTS